MSRRITILEAFFRKDKYYCLAPFERSFGNPAEEIFFGILIAKMKGKKLVVIVRQPTFLRKIISKFKKDRLTNQELFALECPGVIVPRRDIIGYDLFSRLLDCVYVFFLIVRSLVCRLTKFDLFYNEKSRFKWMEMPRFGQNIMFNPDGKKIFSWATAQSYRWDQFLFEPYHVQLDEKKEQVARDAFMHLGIPQDAPYVCLHVRDIGTYAETEASGGYRSANIANYEQAIDCAISRGLWVIRIGDPKMKRAPFKKEKFIDYAFSEHKSDLLDLYLMKNCQLFLCTASGPAEVALLFQKDMILSNITGLSLGSPFKYGDLGLIKYHYSKSRQRFLSVREMLEESYRIDYNCLSQLPGDDADYIMIENTPEDLREVVDEKLGQDSNYTYTELQHEFVRKRVAQVEERIATDPFFRGSCWQAYRFAARVNFKGTMGREFLKRNWEYGESLKKMTEEFHEKGVKRV